MRFPTRTAAVLTVLLGAAPLTGSAATAAPVRALSPTAVAWYDASYQDTTTPAPPAPTDVPAGGAYIAGVTPSSPSLPVALALPTQPLAVMGLRYTLPKGVTATTLTLHLVGTDSSAATAQVPSFAAPLACPASTPVTGGGQQPYTALPAHDCTRSSLGSETATTLTFSDIGHLQKGDQLDVLIFPGTVDRLAVAAPGTTALATAVFGGTTVPLPLGTGGAPVAPGAQPAGGSAAGPLLPGRGPTSSGTVPLSSGTTPSSTGPPTAAGPPSTASTGAAPAALRPAAAITVLRHLGPSEVIASLLVLLALAALLVKADGDPLLPPLAPGTRPQQGLGRFRKQREGAVPGL